MEICWKKKCFICNEEGWRDFFLKIKGKNICLGCLIEIEKEIKSEKYDNLFPKQE